MIKNLKKIDNETENYHNPRVIIILVIMNKFEYILNNIFVFLNAL